MMRVADKAQMGQIRVGALFHNFDQIDEHSALYYLWLIGFGKSVLD
jgi:hypothetical protein